MDIVCTDSLPLEEEEDQTGENDPAADEEENIYDKQEKQRLAKSTLLDRSSETFATVAEFAR